MTELPPAKAGLLRMLIDGAPDRVLQKLEQALGDMSLRDSPLGAVWGMVDREIGDRIVRNLALAPILGLFQGARASLPATLLARLWVHIKTAHPYEAGQAEALANAFNTEDLDQGVLDDLCALTLADLRANPRAETLDAFSDDQAVKVAEALALSPIIRRCQPHLGDWLMRMDQERRAAARVAYRDSVAVAPDAGPLFFQLLGARMAEPGQILRIISAVMDRPSERYLSSSELAPFGVAIMDEVDSQLDIVRHFDVDGGQLAGHDAGQAVHRATTAIADLEELVDLARDGQWGRRLAQQKRLLAQTVEGRLKEIEDVVGHALPVRSIRYSPRLIKSAPKLVADPDPVAVRRAMSLLTFAEEVRSSADSGGFGATRARILDSLEKHLDPYVEDVLEYLRSPDADNLPRARAYLEVAADILTLAKDEKAGQIVRRRLAAA
ncbi:MAG: hypothetical protein GC145_06975 [Caulobacter sp.]|nr:hypothetical protein [Caulobacter sp.]